MSAARVPRCQAASVPRAVGSVRTVAVCGEDRRRLGQRFPLGTSAAFIHLPLGDVKRLDHALVVAVGGVVATDVATARLLDDVGVGEARSALELRVERQAEEAFGDTGWTRLALTVAAHRRDDAFENN